MPSAAYRSAIQARELSAQIQIVTLARVRHDALDAVAWPHGICVAAHVDDVVLGGITYAAAAFRVPWPDDMASGTPTLRIEIGAVDEIVDALSAITTPPTVDVSDVLIAPPAVEGGPPVVTVEMGPVTLRLQRVRIGGDVITADLGYAPVLDTGYPAHAQTPSLRPALF